MPRTPDQAEHMKVVARLKEARLEAGLDQVAVAKSLGKTQSNVFRIESGQHRFDVLQLKAFAKLYDRPSEYFIE